MGAARADSIVPWRVACRLVAALTAPLLVAGCTHVLIHDERRDQQGQDVKKVVAEARIAGTVNALEKSFADVAALEETRARDRAAYLFESELRIASRAPTLTSKFRDEPPQPNGLRTVVEERATAIGLLDVTPAGLRKLRSLAVQMKSRQEALETTIVEFRGTVGHRFEGCTSIYGASDNSAAKSENVSSQFLGKLPQDLRHLAQLKFPALVSDCKRIDQTLEERGKLFAGGVVKGVYDKLDRVQRDLLKYEIDMKSARAELEKAAKALAEVETAAKPHAIPKLETVETRARKVSDLVQTLSEGKDVFGTGAAHAMAAEKLARLEAVLGAIAGASPDASIALSEDVRVSVAVIRGIPALADEANKLLAEARRPRLVPVVAALDQQRLVLEGFEAGRRAKRKQESIIRSELEVVLNEATALASVLAPLKANADWSQRSVGQLLDQLQGDKKVTFTRALAIYADEVKLYRVEGAVWKVRAEAAQYEEGLARSKYASAQWDALIETIASVLADYHAAGIKRADLAEFFKALGLVTIGVGAAQ